MSQARRLMRRLQGVGGNMTAPPSPLDMRESLRSEQDWKRTNCAEELLKIAVEECRIGDFTDCHRREVMHRGENDENSYGEDVPVLTVEQWMLKLAAGALAAAEVLYPDVTADTEKGAGTP